MHVPVLKNEVLKYLDPKSNENFIDCTGGLGGHSQSLLEKTGPKGKILILEVDRELFEKLKIKYAKKKSRVVLVSDSYTNLKEIVRKKRFEKIAGILMDLGLSSWHLEESGRGFSFSREESLDMRYDTKSKALFAEKIVNEYSQEEIERILSEYGQERFARRISKEIVTERKVKPIKTTFQLVEIIEKATPSWYQRRKIHPATKTFQALRIAVNDELENLKKVLPQTLEVLMPGGRLATISFHSLEDRIIKNFFKQMAQFRSREEAKEGLQILTKKPIKPSSEEIKNNPRSRSARLRAAKRI